MKEIANANKTQNLLAFEKLKTNYAEELSEYVIKRHFHLLYNSLLERNLIKIVLPYSEVQIEYIAQQICLPLQNVQ